MEYLMNIWYAIIDFISFLFDVSLVTASWILIIVILFLVISLVLVLLFKKFKKIILSIKEKLIFEYDNIFYLLASAQYKKEIDKSSIGGDPCIAAIKSIINKNSPTYLNNQSLIKENVGKVEKLLGESVVDLSLWKKINFLNNKLKSISFLYKILRFLFILIVIFLLGGFVYIVSF